MTTCVFVRSQVCTGAEESMAGRRPAGRGQGLELRQGAGCGRMSRSLSATPSRTPGTGSLGLSVDRHPAGRGGNRSPSLRAWPKGSWQPPPRQDTRTEAASPVCAGQFWGHVSAHSRSKVCSWGDAYSRCRLVVSETNSSASQAAVISEAKVSNEGSADRTPHGDEQGG